MDLSIITVPWNVKDLTRESFKAIYANTENISFEVFAVDNDSHDGSAEMIALEFPQIRLIANKYNAGFAKANNQAMRESKGRYILLLNPDMRVKEASLEKMVKWMDEHKDTGVAGCHLLDENNETIPHVRRFPRVWDQLAIIFKIPHLFPWILNGYLMKDFDYSKEAVVDSVRGAFFMIRREVYEKIGGLDELYFIWFEEVDYCRQVKNVGWKVMYTPDIECIDHIGKSFAQLPRGQAQVYFRDSMLKYFKKWEPRWQYKLLKLAWPVGIALARAGEAIRFKVQQKN